MKVIKRILKGWVFIVLVAWIYILCAFGTAGKSFQDGWMGFTVVLVLAMVMFLWLRDKWRAI